MVNKDTIIGDVLDICPDAIPVLLDMGMHCLGCPASRGETIEEACMVHGKEPSEIVDKINSLIKD